MIAKKCVSLDTWALVLTNIPFRGLWGWNPINQQPNLSDLDTFVEQKCLNYLGMWMREADQASLWDDNELTHRAHRRPIHSELTPTTTWRAHRDDLTNSSQQAHGVSFKLTESSQCELIVKIQCEQTKCPQMSFPWVSIWAPNELAVSSNSSLGIRFGDKVKPVVVLPFLDIFWIVQHPSITFGPGP